MRKNSAGRGGCVLFVLAVLCGVLCVALSIGIVAKWDITRIANDGSQYLNTASNFLQGHGFSTDILVFGPHFQESLPAVQTVWPPAYPAFIALVKPLAGDYTLAALYVNIAAVFLSALILFLILKRLGLSIRYALVAAVVFCCTVTQWEHVIRLVSEALFTLAILAGLYTLPNYKVAAKWPYLIPGLLLAFSLLVRHSAVLFIAGTGIGVFLLLMHESWKKQADLKTQIVALIFLGGPSVVVFGLLNLRIRLATGTAISTSGVNEPLSLDTYLYTLFSEASWFVGFYSNSVFPALIASVVALAFAGLLVCFVVMWWLITRKRVGQSQSAYQGGMQRGQDGSRASANPAKEDSVLRYTDIEKIRSFRTLYSLVILCHSALFLIYFSYVALTDVPLSIDRRYMLQVYPSLLILFFVMLFQMFRETGHVRRVSLWLVGIILLLFSIAQVNAYTRLVLPNTGNAELLRILDFGSENGQTPRSIINACFDTHSINSVPGITGRRDKGVLWSTRGQTLHTYLGIPSIAPANRHFQMPVDYAELSRHIETYDVRMLVLIPHMALESEWKTRELIKWAENEKLPSLRITGYSSDPQSFTDLVFLDPTCVPVVVDTGNEDKATEEKQ